jgi:uncharacterized membrane protein
MPRGRLKVSGYLPSVFAMIFTISAYALSAAAFTFSPRIEDTITAPSSSHLGDGDDAVG